MTFLQEIKINEIRVENRRKCISTGVRYETVFEREFSGLVNQLAPHLHSRRPLPMDIIVVPTSKREDINQLLNRIRLALSSDVGTAYFEETNVHWNRRSQYTVQKNIIPESIVRIAETYS